MKPDEVVRFVAYIIDLAICLDQDKEAYDDWHKAFRDITFEQAKIVAFGKEHGKALPALVKIRIICFPVVSGSKNVNPAQRCHIRGETDRNKRE